MNDLDLGVASDGEVNIFEFKFFLVKGGRGANSIEFPCGNVGILSIAAKCFTGLGFAFFNFIGVLSELIFQSGSDLRKTPRG